MTETFRADMPSVGSNAWRQQQAADQSEIRRLRSSLFKFINSKQRPKNYSMMVRYLLHWKVSIYSMVWTDVLLWAILYTIVNVVYRHFLTSHQQMYFVRLVHSVGVWQSNVPVTFLLGFYVSTVVDRWWCAYMSIPSMGTNCLKINAAVRSGDMQKAEQIRITISRYMNLAWLLCMWKISEKVKTRFRILRNLISEANRMGARSKMTQQRGSRSASAKENPSHLEHSGNFDMFHFRIDRNRRLYPALRRISSAREESEDVNDEQIENLVQDLVLLNQDPVVQETYGEIVTPSEIAVYVERARCASGGHYSIEYELPLHWATAVAHRAFIDGFLTTEDSYTDIVTTCGDWATKLSTTNKFSAKSLPLVYTQVVIIAVYTWFFIEVVSSQNLIESHVGNVTQQVEAPTRLTMQYWTDFYVPVFALLKLLFVLGWFKVAFILMDPFGDDMDDLPLSDVLNSNLRKGRSLGGFSPHLYPRKLQRALNSDSNADYLHSDEEITQELIHNQAGPWLETLEEKDLETSYSHSEMSFASDRIPTPEIAPQINTNPVFQQTDVRQPLIGNEIP